MKYCPECGLDLKKLDKEYKKHEVKEPANFKKFRISSSILTIISSSLCLIFAIVALLYSNNNPYYYEYSAVRSMMSNIYLFLAAFAFFAFFMGLFGGLSIIYKKFYNIALNMHFVIIILALLTVINHICAFVFLGVPILTMTLISLFLLSYSKKDFA